MAYGLTVQICFLNAKSTNQDHDWFAEQGDLFAQEGGIYTHKRLRFTGFKSGRDSIANLNIYLMKFPSPDILITFLQMFIRPNTPMMIGGPDNAMFLSSSRSIIVFEESAQAEIEEATANGDNVFVVAHAQLQNQAAFLQALLQMIEMRTEDEMHDDGDDSGIVSQRVVTKEQLASTAHLVGTKPGLNQSFLVGSYKLTEAELIAEVCAALGINNFEHTQFDDEDFSVETDNVSIYPTYGKLPERDFKGLTSTLELKIETPDYTPSVDDGALRNWASHFGLLLEVDIPSDQLIGQLRGYHQLQGQTLQPAVINLSETDYE